MVPTRHKSTLPQAEKGRAAVDLNFPLRMSCLKYGGRAQKELKKNSAEYSVGLSKEHA
jgi:hypothetical protein